MSADFTSSAPPILKVALVGYGSMGQEVERLASQYGCTVQAIYHSKHPLQATDAVLAELADVDVAIDFSKPVLVVENLRVIAQANINLVLGTTGWTAYKDEVERIVRESGIGVVWGANFSVGMQMFMQIVRTAAALVEHYDEYDVALHELHHRRKQDSPSGTALALADVLTHAISRKTSVLGEPVHGKMDNHALHTSSTRVGEIPGTHTLYLDSAADTLELTHRARNRSGFAAGALRAAQWIRGKTGYYDFAEIFPNLHNTHCTRNFQ
jgi:4-hydroxy-tetrahydrodipicolinate reductase